MEAAQSAAALGTDRSLRAAHRLLVWTFGLLIVGVIIGIGWDRSWHTQHAFDTFYSPPHLFIYSVATVTTLLAAGLALLPPLRRPFGLTMRLPLLCFAVPAALVLLLGGFATLGLAGLLDNLWHSTFGLDETGWSTPHAMIGWALLGITWGFVACRLALRPARPVPGYTLVFLSLILVMLSVAPFMGPLGSNNTPAIIAAIHRFPVLAAQPAAAHTARIELAWNLTHSNPLLVPLGALWLGTILALLRALDPRPWVALTAITLWSALGWAGDHGTVQAVVQLGLAPAALLTDRAGWLPLPLLPAALACWLVRRVTRREGIAWAAAGVVFGVLALATWGPQPAGWAGPLLIAAALLAGLGAALGRRIGAVLLHPDGRTVPWLVLLGVAVPGLTGLVDLWLRTVTP